MGTFTFVLYLTIEVIMISYKDTEYKEIPNSRGTCVAQCGCLYNHIKDKHKKQRECHGYSQASINQKTALVHRLVYKAWKGSIPEGLQINHIDGNKLNNHIDNLEAVTSAENSQHDYASGLMDTRFGERSHTAKLSNQDVIDIKRLAQEGDLTRQQIADTFDISRNHIYTILRGETRNRG